jgi:hypothetical protein
MVRVMKKAIWCYPNNQSEEYKTAVSHWMTLKLHKIQKMIAKLRVSPQRDCLTIKYEEDLNLWEAKKKYCKEIENTSNASARVESSYKDCCVCAEETTNKTTCNHPICIVCLSRLNKQKCPICRSTIYPEDDDSSEYDDDDSDDEEEEEEEEHRREQQTQDEYQNAVENSGTLLGEDDLD